MRLSVERRGEVWTATHAMRGRTLALGLAFSVVPAKAKVVVTATGAESPFFSRSRIVAEAVQGVEQALAEARVRWWLSRIEMRDSDAPAPAQAMYLACAITRAALAADA